MRSVDSKIIIHIIGGNKLERGHVKICKWMTVFSNISVIKHC